MATVLIRRRFPRLSRVTTFLTTAKCKAERESNKSKQKEENPETPNSRPESTATIQLLDPSDYRVLYNPSAYAKSRAASQQSAARSCSQALTAVWSEAACLGHHCITTSHLCLVSAAEAS